MKINCTITLHITTINETNQHVSVIFFPYHEQPHPPPPKNVELLKWNIFKNPAYNNYFRCCIL